jgi:hypothetical protein
VVSPHPLADNFAQRDPVERHITKEIVDGTEIVVDRRPIVSGIEIGLESDVVAAKEEAPD